MSGLPPIRILGCDPDCEHEWGFQKTMPPGYRSSDTHPGPLQGIANTNRDQMTRGQFCQKCGGWRGALGNEPTIEMYIGHLVVIYKELYRVLREDGVAWCVMGDSYAGSWGNYAPGGIKGTQRPRTEKGKRWERKAYDDTAWRPPTSYYPQGNLMMVPHRLALALQADGWVIRNDLVWHKKAPMPESVKGWTWQRHRIKVGKSDRATNLYQNGAGTKQGAGVASRAQREAYYENGEGAPQWIDCPGCKKCEANDGYVLKRGSWRHTRAHETVLMCTKKMQYFADQEKVRKPCKNISVARGQRRENLIARTGRGALHKQQTSLESGNGYNHAYAGLADGRSGSGINPSGRNPRSVLTPKPENFPGQHFAVYPTSLIEPLIKATCPDKCCPKCGKGWAATVNRTALRSAPRDFVDRGNDKRGRKLRAGNCQGNILGYRPTCECAVSPGMKEIEVPYESGGDSGFYAPDPVPGAVLDPFGGAGTTGLVASRLGLDSILIEISEEYARLSRKRISDDAPLFNQVSLEFLNETNQ